MMKSAVYIIANYYPHAVLKLESIKKENELIGKGDSYRYYNEDEIVRTLMGKKGSHMREIKAWKRQWEEKVITFIINDASQAFMDDKIIGIYITGEFLLRNDNDEHIHKSLEDIGFDAYLDRIEEDFYDILEASIVDHTPLPDAIGNWEAYNRHYEYPERTYISPKAVVVTLDNGLFESKDRYNYYEGSFNPIISSIVNMLSNDYRIVFICDRPKSEANDTIKQIQEALQLQPDESGKKFSYYFSYSFGLPAVEYRKRIFYEKLQFGYDIQYVLESDPNSLIFWRKIGIYTMFLGNPWKLTKEKVKK